MKYKIFCILCVVFTVTSCRGQHAHGTPEVDPITIQKKFMDWWQYQNDSIMLSSDFLPLDVASRKITKQAFLSELTLGNYIPIRLQSDDNQLYYQLFKIDPTADTSIKATIMQVAFDEYAHFLMEGKPFPAFTFVDLEGNTHTNESLKGKIVVIKCWYIHCAACVKEFPAVNKLVQDYKNRKEVVFVSLAEDTPEQLRTFLAKKPLLYAVVPNMKKYMNETLELNAFPTHFILNKEGNIVKVLSNYESLAHALALEIQ